MSSTLNSWTSSLSSIGRNAKNNEPHLSRGKARSESPLPQPPPKLLSRNLSNVGGGNKKDEFLQAQRSPPLPPQQPLTKMYCSPDSLPRSAHVSSAMAGISNTGGNPNSNGNSLASKAKLFPDHGHTDALVTSYIVPKLEQPKGEIPVIGDVGTESRIPPSSLSNSVLLDIKKENRPSKSPAPQETATTKRRPIAYHVIDPNRERKGLIRHYTKKKFKTKDDARQNASATTSSNPATVSPLVMPQISSRIGLFPRQTKTREKILVATQGGQDRNVLDSPSISVHPLSAKKSRPLRWDVKKNDDQSDQELPKQQQSEFIFTANSNVHTYFSGAGVNISAGEVSFPSSENQKHGSIVGKIKSEKQMDTGDNTYLAYDTNAEDDSSAKKLEIPKSSLNSFVLSAISTGGIELKKPSSPDPLDSGGNTDLAADRNYKKNCSREKKDILKSSLSSSVLSAISTGGTVLKKPPPSQHKDNKTTSEIPTSVLSEIKKGKQLNQVSTNKEPKEEPFSILTQIKMGKKLKQVTRNKPDTNPSGDKGQSSFGTCNHFFSVCPVESDIIHFCCSVFFLPP